ncbi:MAG TPA: hypothetical protein VFY40_15280 [Blastocatellia bacterium]|nr:hypothetical protein [Blastocatellia bacterium]
MGKSARSLLLIIVLGLSLLYGRAHEAAHSDAAEAAARLKKLGERRAIVFSPDFAASGNRRLYEGLGFLYVESADWRWVLKEIMRVNRSRKEGSIREIFFETHGSNGNGLKLQRSQQPRAPRSYISLGALQENLAAAGVERAILGACNTGRLYRPEIYKRLNLAVKDPTVLPPTLGVVNASPGFDPSKSPVALIRRTESRLEGTSEGQYRELPQSVRLALDLSDSTKPFTVSNMFIQTILGDARLQVTSAGYVRKLSKEVESEPDNEAIFQSFLKFLDDLASDRGSSVRANYYLESRREENRK